MRGGAGPGIVNRTASEDSQIAMTLPSRVMNSPYMEFSKLRSGATYSLATSGVASYPLAGLPVRLQDLEINGPTDYGYAPLQQRLARLNRVSPDCVVTAAGTSMANHLAMAALIEPGDEVLIEEPTYELLLSTAAYLQASVRRFQRAMEQDYRVDPEALARQVTPRTRLIVISNLHNPSGAIVPVETLRAVGEIARSVRARVLVDEVYLEAMFEQRPPTAFSLGNEFVVTSSLTKAYGLSGLRCGWILCEPALAARVWQLNDLFAATPVHVGELLSVIALDHLDQVAGKAKDLISANRAALDRFLAAQTSLQFFRPPHGTVIFPRLRNGNVDDLFDLLKSKYDTTFAPGRFFERPQHFRLGIGGDPEMTAEGFNRLSAALAEFAA